MTAQYMDVEARLENLKAQRTRLQQLQQQAETLSDLLEIESSLTEVQSQIESWQSQMDWYSNQVEQCTVYVSLSEVKTYSPPSESFVSRMADAFASGWQNFAQGVQQLAVFLAGAWPVVVIAAAVAGGVAVWRKRESEQARKKTRKFFFRKGLTSIPLCGIILEQSARAAESTK